MSFPFYGKEFTFIQPDKTELKVKGWGDQHQAVFETLDGYSVAQDPLTGFYQVGNLHNHQLKPTGLLPGTIDPATLGIKKGLRESREVIKSKVFSAEGLTPGNSRWKQRRQEANDEIISRALSGSIMLAPPRRETVGTFQGLCLLIQFPDVQGSFSASQVNDFCNKKGYTGFENNGSVYDYFLDNSNGKLKYTNIVAPYYTAKYPRNYYTNEKVSQPIRANELIEEALEYHKSNGMDFSKLSSDNKDYVFALNLFYAGEVVNGWAKGLWPHSHHLNQAFNLAPGKNSYDYQITNMGHELTLATFCHENGHMICDFHDLYDYGYDSRGVGIFCLMCSGGSADSKNPVQVGAYLKFKAGWSGQVSNITPGTSAVLNSAGNQFSIFRKNATEYVIIENRYQSLRDASLPGSGLAIWHVDEVGNNENQQMTSSLHYQCSLIQADGKCDLENSIDDGDENDLFSAPLYLAYGKESKPSSKWWDGASTGLEIFDISESGSQMQFSVK